MNTLRLLSEFHQGSLTLADTWRGMFAPENAETVLVLAREAGKLVDTARREAGDGRVGGFVVAAALDGRDGRRPLPRSTSRTTSGPG